MLEAGARLEAFITYTKHLELDCKRLNQLPATFGFIFAFSNQTITMKKTISSLARVIGAQAQGVVATGASATGASSIGATAVGAMALGAFAVGAIAVGALAIGRLAIRRAVIKDLKIGTLTVDRLIIRNQEPTNSEA